MLAAEPLFLLADTAAVGHLGRVPLAALGACVTVMSMLTIIGTTLEYGTTGRAARHFGAGDRESAVVEGVQASWIALAAGLVCVAIGQLVAEPVTELLAGGPGEVARAAESWLRIAICGLPGILLVLAAHGWLRGVQDTRTPVVIVVIANVISIAALPLLVYAAGLGLEGSAIANVGAQTVGALLALRALARERPDPRPHWNVMRGQLVVSRDLILRALAFQAAFMTAAAVAGRMGAAHLGAHQVGLQLWIFVALLLDSFAIAAMSLVGAALGSHDAGAARSVAWRVMRYGLWAGVVFALVLAAGWWLIPRAFTSDAATIHQIHLLWPLLAAMGPLCGLLFALDGVMMGAGDNRFLAWTTVAAAICGYIPITVVAYNMDWGITGIWAGLTSFVVIRLAAALLRLRGDRWLVLGATR